MAYPEKGATYKHEPKFIDRMKDEENDDNTPFEQSDFEPKKHAQSLAQQLAEIQDQVSKEVK